MARKGTLVQIIREFANIQLVLEDIKEIRLGHMGLQTDFNNQDKNPLLFPLGRGQATKFPLVIGYQDIKIMLILQDQMEEKLLESEDVTKFIEDPIVVAIPGRWVKEIFNLIVLIWNVFTPPTHNVVYIIVPRHLLKADETIFLDRRVAISLK